MEASLPQAKVHFHKWQGTYIALASTSPIEVACGKYFYHSRIASLQKPDNECSEWHFKLSMITCRSCAKWVEKNLPMCKEFYGN